MKALIPLKMLLLIFFAHIAIALPEIGQLAPAFSLASSEGKSVSLADFAGKTVVLEWTNHQCPYVKKHYRSKNMQQLQKKYTARDVVWLSIISSAPGKQGFVSPEQADRLTAQRDAVPTKVLLDPTGKVGRSYSAKTTPHMYIIDTKGVLRYMGGIDSIRSSDIEDIARAENYVDQGLTQLLAGKDIRYPKTRPYGCSVKYAKL